MVLRVQMLLAMPGPGVAEPGDAQTTTSPAAPSTMPPPSRRHVRRDMITPPLFEAMRRHEQAPRAEIDTTSYFVIRTSLFRHIVWGLELPVADVAPGSTRRPFLPEPGRCRTRMKATGR